MGSRHDLEGVGLGPPLDEEVYIWREKEGEAQSIVTWSHGIAKIRAGL